MSAGFLNEKTGGFSFENFVYRWLCSVILNLIYSYGLK